jgi:hypothetical protein
MKSRRVNRRMTRRTKTRKTHRKAGRKMRGGNTHTQTYSSPLFVNLTDKYGADIAQGPALSQ